jgi:hypothetical protein
MVRDWIVANDATAGRDAYSLECKRCGTIQRFTVPIAVWVWCKAAKAFERQHAKFQPPRCECDCDGCTCSCGTEPLKSAAPDRVQ